MTVMEYINKRVNRTSQVKDVEIMKEPFEKTATHKIRRFLYTGKKDNTTDDGGREIHEGSDPAGKDGR